MGGLNRFCNLCLCACLFRISLSFSVTELPNAWPTSLSLTVDRRLFCVVRDLGIYLPGDPDRCGVLAAAVAGGDSVLYGGCADVRVFALARVPAPTWAQWKAAGMIGIL